MGSDQMARRAAKEIKNGMYVNLGIGIPTLVSNFIPNDINITLQSDFQLKKMGSRFNQCRKTTITELEKLVIFQVLIVLQ